MIRVESLRSFIELKKPSFNQKFDEFSLIETVLELLK